MKNMRFFNRELSWIEFNARVLSEAQCKSVPLLERLNFLSIVSSNFDEFFMVRVAGLRRCAHSQLGAVRDVSGRTPSETLKEISARAHGIVNDQYECLMNDIIPALAREGIFYVKPSEYTHQHRRFLDEYFREQIFPVLTPLRVAPGLEFPHAGNLQTFAGFLLSKTAAAELGGDFSDGAPSFVSDTDDFPENPIVITQIPQSLDGVIWLPGISGSKCFALLEDVIHYFGTQLFPGFDVAESLLFKVTRDADFSVDENRDEDFIQAMEEVLINRQFSKPVRLTYTNGSERVLAALAEKLELGADDLYCVNGPIELGRLLALSKIDGVERLRYPVWKHYQPVSISSDEPFWDELKRADLLLHTPYESYEPVLRFLNDAADDPDVLAVKITLYRTSGDSPVIKALERAARAGKQVTAFVELKARFDEGRNISWAQRLEKAGAIVVYGIARLKVHAKIALIVRRESNGVCRYAHLATGNYNDKTARLYTDLSLFTAAPDIANDATLFFNMITGCSAIQPMRRLIMAPIDLKRALLSMIDRESRRSAPERPGLIMAKMNSLADPDVIEALYRANGAGVQIRLNVRGICMLVPGIPGQSERIEVVSVVDRYLEHSRIFYFDNGGLGEVYLSSADWMPRNLERRVELMFPVADRALMERITNILRAYFDDNCKAHALLSDGSWKRRQAENQDAAFRVQEYFYSQAKERVSAAQLKPHRQFNVRRD